jgi:hypothetical protein
MKLITGIPNTRYEEANESTDGYTLSYKTLRDEENHRQEVGLQQRVAKLTDQTVRDFLYGTAWKALKTAYHVMLGHTLILRYCEPVRMEGAGKVSVSWRLSLEWE